MIQGGTHITMTTQQGGTGASRSTVGAGMSQNVYQAVQEVQLAAQAQATRQTSNVGFSSITVTPSVAIQTNVVQQQQQQQQRPATVAVPMVTSLVATPSPPVVMTISQPLVSTATGGGVVVTLGSTSAPASAASGTAGAPPGSDGQQGDKSSPYLTRLRNQRL